MALTPQQLNRATLARQVLLHREPLGVVDGVRRVVALQAQHPASPYLALWNRVRDLEPSAVDAAFTRGSLVKGTLLRVTLHAVAAEDHAVFHSAMRPMLTAAIAGGRTAAGGLGADEILALLPELLRFADRPRTAAQLQSWVTERLRDRPGTYATADAPGEKEVEAVWRALRIITPLQHAPTGGPWSFGPRPSYVAASTPAPTEPPGHGPDHPPTPDEGLRTLVRRYLEGFGPATVADVAQFTRLPRSRVRTALVGLAGDVRTLAAADGSELWDVPDGPLPDADTPAPHASWRCGTARSSPTPTAAASSRRTCAGPSSGRTGTCCPRSWSTATSPVCGGRSPARSRRPPSTPCPTTPGRDSRPRRATSSRSSRTATRRCTAATTTGGARCRRARSGCSPADARLTPRDHAHRHSRPLRPPGPAGRRPRPRRGRSAAGRRRRSARRRGPTTAG
ncbi:winged helix DNA-binding domain-containing protein [Cellulomonas sp. ATA003]|nr:winged helix DNA-binding domain-containing protein [Cellulomonas sp. ATA003]WNB84405.1 winged helix DNA-binding domain-containing protein [Cellulomonas sp. ATA003]